MSRFLDRKYENLVPYTPGEQPKTTGRLIKLNTNENPYDPSPEVMKVINSEEVCRLRLYSDPEASELIDAAAGYYGVDRDMIAAGNGSDEILAFIFMALQGSGGRIYYPEISYSFYPVYCDIFGAEGVPVPLRDGFVIDPEDYRGLDGTIVITNPNAPTGRALTRDMIESIVSEDRDRLVVIDEAYVDFGAESAVPLTKKYDNILVVQTLSKSRSLAGARIGLAVGSRELTADLNRIKFSFNPYNLNRLSIRAGAAALRDRKYFEETCAKVIATRESFVKAMEDLGFDVIPSKANFVFASHPKLPAEDYFRELRKRDIIVRYFSGEKVRRYVRITIGTDEDMDALLKATEEILAGRE